MSRAATTRRDGVILLAVMLSMLVATMVAASLAFHMHAERSAAAAATTTHQGWSAAVSGVHKAMALLRRSQYDTAAWYDNPDELAEQFVRDDGADRWYFTVYAYNETDPETVRYGVTDEAGKINLNLADEKTLHALGSLTARQIDCLMDFRDSDDETRPEGAEQDFYDAQPRTFRVKNGPILTIEELLGVRGFTAGTLFGEDANLSGLLEPNEDDGDERFPVDDGDGELDRGLRAVAAAYSYEPNVDRKGRPRTSLTAKPRKLIQAGLDRRAVEFLVLYRAEGQSIRHPADLLNLRYPLTKDHTFNRRPTRSKTYKAGQWIESGLGREELPLLVDGFTTFPANREIVVGLVNVNTAPRAVLTAVTGDEDLARRIVDARSDLDVDTRSTIAWLYTEGLVNEGTFKKLAPKLTARGFQFHVQVVGYAWPSGRYRVVEAVIDLAQRSPRVTYLRDLTQLGLPFAIDMDEEVTR